jgi:hypothetical protein
MMGANAHFQHLELDGSQRSPRATNCSSESRIPILLRYLSKTVATATSLYRFPKSIAVIPLRSMTLGFATASWSVRTVSGCRLKQAECKAVPPQKSQSLHPNQVHLRSAISQSALTRKMLHSRVAGNRTGSQPPVRMAIN